MWRWRPSGLAASLAAARDLHQAATNRQLPGSGELRARELRRVATSNSSSSSLEVLNFDTCTNIYYKLLFIENHYCHNDCHTLRTFDMLIICFLKNSLPEIVTHIHKFSCLNSRTTYLNAWGENHCNNRMCESSDVEAA